MQSAYSTKEIIFHPNGKIYIPLAAQAIYNFVMNPDKEDLKFMKTYCTQYLETITQDELQARMSDGTIKLGNGKVYTVNWMQSATTVLKAKNVILYFRTPNLNVNLYPRVLISAGYNQNC
jgi:hypothetical protein